MTVYRESILESFSEVNMDNSSPISKKNPHKLIANCGTISYHTLFIKSSAIRNILNNLREFGEISVHNGTKTKISNASGSTQLKSSTLKKMSQDTRYWIQNFQF